MALPEPRRHGRDVSPPEAQRRGDPQVSADDVMADSERVGKVVQFVEQRSRPTAQQLAFLGQAQVPRRAVEQPAVEPPLDLAEALRDR